MGAGIDFAEHESGNGAGTGGRIFFTKNGVFIGHAFANLATGSLYPTVGLRTPGERVQANFGSDPFAFDIDGFVRVSHHRCRRDMMYPVC